MARALARTYLPILLSGLRALPQTPVDVPRHPLRIHLALVLLSLAALYGTGRAVWTEARLLPGRAPVDTLAAVLDGFSALRSALPPDARVGFVAPPGAEARLYWYHLNAAQHALVPVHVTTAADASWLLSYTREGAASSAHDSLQLVAEADGALLWRVP